MPATPRVTAARRILAPLTASAVVAAGMVALAPATQAVSVKLLLTEDSSLQTSFVVDDTAVTTG